MLDQNGNDDAGERNFLARGGAAQTARAQTALFVSSDGGGELPSALGIRLSR